MGNHLTVYVEIPAFDPIFADALREVGSNLLEGRARLVRGLP